jgi:xanthine dehydrogenase accessory factor
MKELLCITEAYSKLRSQGKSAAIATVVRTSGSTYRKPGARMLIAEDGRTIGSVSGGCLERDVFRQAQRVFQSHQPRLVTYDSTSEDDIVWGFGLGCNGVVDILIEYLPSDNSNQIEFLTDCIKNRKDGVLGKVFAIEGAIDARVGDHLSLRNDLSMESTIPDRDLKDELLGDALKAMESTKSQIKVYETPNGRVGAFVEMIQPPLPVAVFGAGHDAVPVVRLAKEMGWHVTLVDGRPGYATASKFPNVDEIVVARPETIEEHLSLTERTMAIIMNHNFTDDSMVLKTLVSSQVKYIGLLGPKHRTQKLLESLRNEGVTLSEDQLKRLHGPVGIDIGADTPEEIALSIIAEIKAAAAGRECRSLKNYDAPLHSRSENVASRSLSESPALRAVCSV